MAIAAKSLRLIEVRFSFGGVSAGGTDGAKKPEPVPVFVFAGPFASFDTTARFPLARDRSMLTGLLTSYTPGKAARHDVGSHEPMVAHLPSHQHRAPSLLQHH